MARRHRLASISASSLVIAATIVSLLRVLPARASEQKYRTVSNDQALEMLKLVETDIKGNYYDPTFHGLDLEGRFEQARREITAAKSQDEAFLDIAGAVAALNDSHTRFIPPARPYGVDYGWNMQAIGDASCYVVAVRPGSDAASKGLRPGDRVVSVNGVKVLRQDIDYLTYSFRVFPQSGLHVDVQSPDGSQRSLVVMANIIPGQEVVRHSDVVEWMRHYHGPADRSRYYKPNKRVLFWKLPDFFLSPEDAAHLVESQRSYDTIVLDLRGNPGGRSEAMDKFIGAFFDHDIKIGDRRTRTEINPEMAKGRGGKAFSGKLIVLIDSESHSASEIFARVVQLKRRGIVLGDRSGGAVMEAKLFIHAVPLDATNVAQYQTSVTIADVIMSDGKSLENVGVTPDEWILPTPADIAAGRDPVLARAAAIAGIEMTPEEAGKIFPFDWPKEEMPVIGE